MWGFVASQVLISPFLDGYCVNLSYHKRIGCQAVNGASTAPHPISVALCALASCLAARLRYNSLESA